MHSEIMVTRNKRRCPICAEVVGEPHPQHGAYGEMILGGNTTVTSTPDLVCVPSLGPLNAHHLLIVPTRHVRSLAEITDPDVAKEICNLKAKLAAYNERHFSVQTAFFEHGTGNQPDANCACIEHAHLHALGVNADILPFLTEHYQFQQCDADALHKDQQLVGKGYYFYEHTKSQAVVCTQRLEPQFFRILYWKVLGNWSSWNWRLHYNLPLVADVLGNYQSFQFSPVSSVESSNRERTSNPPSLR